MARKTARPGRTLGAFFIGLAIAFGLVALAGTWKPVLGLDLQGGTSIRLTPKGSPTSSALNEARKIIDERVNGSGVSEAQVTVQGNKYVVVQIPGKSRRDLVETVRRQAQLRFRVVACSLSSPGPCATGTSTGLPSASPGAGVELPSASPTAAPGTGVTIAPSASGSAGASTGASTDASSGASASSGTSPSGGDNRAPARYAPVVKASATPSDTPSASASSSASSSASGSAGASPSSAASPSATASASSTNSDAPIPAPDGGKTAKDALTWVDAPNAAAVKAFNDLTCPASGAAVNVEDDPDKPLVTCGTGDDAGNKYLLSTAMIEGDQLSNAAAEIPQSSLSYVVSLSFDGSGTSQFTKISKALYGTTKQFAVVLDGQVISAPTMDGLITNGQAQISGNFTESSAQSLATSLKYGALPVQFGDFTAETVGPSLAGDQLRAGITAGIAGLILVMIYCLLYYRGLGTVVVGSLLIAGAATYAMVLLLSKAAGFTLTLPGIAGLIVAVGITADSFIVYFERIRDEMREGRSMRVAVEAGWVRARATCLAADAVSLLAAVVLYIFTASVVRGFAFALGLSTAIDLVVFFFFTKPLVSSLAKVRFFNSGHRLSGLGAETLGIDKVAPDRPRRPVGATTASRGSSSSADVRSGEGRA